MGREYVGIETNRTNGCEILKENANKLWDREA